MNERIRELYKQALEFSYNNVPQEDWNTGVFHPIVSGKFAELIVRECMRMCDVAATGYDTHGLTKEASGCDTAKEYIADWFEIE